MLLTSAPASELIIAPETSKDENQYSPTDEGICPMMRAGSLDVKVGACAPVLDRPGHQCQDYKFEITEI